MKKLLLFILLFSAYFNAFAQLDREHWFAPMVDRTGNYNQFQRLYMSTDDTTPFKVDIYNNNVIIGSVTISKNNPGKFDIPRHHIITTPEDQYGSTVDGLMYMFKPISKGIYLKGEKPFFASLRFSVFNHGEMQTSKGGAALGTEFRAVMAPITANNEILNFMTSVLATEDNTTVTINEFGNNVRFSDNVTRSSFTFTLNRGQSYIIDGTGNYTQNRNGTFIGAKIVSNKPIVIANGNFNGQYATTATNSSDILMDQGVPIDKLGQEFVLMKGNGTTVSGMEKAIIVAIENNTQIYLNGATTPSATINAGQYYITENDAYKIQGSGHYNLHIKTNDKNIYVYQLLAGANNSSALATGGLNYIPPLSCYLPKKIDEIGLINENQYLSNNGGSLNVPTKLNIITEKGATIDVKRNGTSLTLNSSNGPFNVTGTNNWVTYSIPNITGNIAVFSTHAVTAGISAGDDAVGYGGYFAGFSFIPAIIKQTGECLPDVVLEVTEGFDSYQWLIKVGTNYVPAPGVNNLYTYQPTQAGIYSVKVKQGSCDEVQTGDFKFQTCVYYTPYTYEICSTKAITPTFELSSQALNPSSIVIDTQPTKGTIVIGTDGTITYTANPNATGTDFFKYTFCGVGLIPDCETAEVTINLNQIEKQDVILRECSTNGIATYDLTAAPVTSMSGITKTFYTDAAFTQPIPPAQWTNYSSADGIVYVKMTNAFGCEASAKIELKAKPSPVANAELYTKAHCDDEIDGVIDGVFFVKLDDITPVVVPNAANFTVRYYQTQPQAIAGGNDNLTGNYSFTTNTSIWIRVDSANDCPPAIKEIQLKTGSKLVLSNDTVPAKVCDDDLNGNETINLADYISDFNNTVGVTATYHNSISDAEDNLNPISSSQNITGDRIIYYRLSLSGFCDAIGTLSISFKQPTPPSLEISYSVCETATLPIDAGSGYISYEWDNGDTNQTTNLGAGSHWVKVTNADGCTYTHNFIIHSVPGAQLNIDAFNGMLCDENFDGTIEVNLPTDVTAVVLTNAADYTVRYYTSLPFANAGGTNNLPDNWSYNTATTLYIRVDSPFCPAIIKPINFGFANILATNPVDPQKVCDEDLNNSEVVNLQNYISFFTSATGVTARYFNSLPNAQSNTGNIPANQTITDDTTFYLRLSAPGFCDVVVTLNLELKPATASTLLQPEYTICENEQITLDVGSGFSGGILWSTGATSATITVGAGTYWVDLTNEFGCTYHQIVKVLGYPIAKLDPSKFNGMLCDENFDGIINVNLATEVTPVILPNAQLYTVRYYTTPEFANAGGNNNLPDNWSYSSPTTLYIRVDSPHCPPVFGTIDFGFGNAVPLLTNNYPDAICDDEGDVFDGIRSVNLQSYKSMFTGDNAVQLSFFETQSDAHQNINEISSPAEFSGTKTFYIRFSKNGLCTSIGTLTITIKIPKASDVLAEADTEICPDTTITLDVGSGFDTYTWSTGDIDTPITVGIGEYWVDLTFNRCTYRQEIKITAVDLPVITSVEIQGTTVTINASGGNPPYRYSLDGINYQDSNIFTNAPYGQNTAYVISADDCAAITQDFTVIRILNVITPNGDGKNDVLNYSDLAYKEDVKLKVYDRNGALIFTGTTANNYTWDGKTQGRPVPTSSYWYVLEWRDPGTTFVTQNKGWVLVKNRE